MVAADRARVHREHSAARHFGALGQWRLFRPPAETRRRVVRAGRVREHSPAGDGRDGTLGKKLRFRHYRVAGERQGFDHAPLGMYPIRTRTMSIEECNQRAFIPGCHHPSALTSTSAPSARPDDAQECVNSRNQATAVLQLQAEKGAARAPKLAARQGREEGRASRRSRPATPTSGRGAFVGSHATPGAGGWREAAGAGRAAELVLIMGIIYMSAQMRLRRCSDFVS